MKADLDISKLDKSLLDELSSFIDNTKDKEGNLISILHRAQNLFGYLPVALQLYIARYIGMPAANVNGVVSFYSYFTQEPTGKHTISVCTGTACHVKGSSKILKKFMNELDVEINKITKDGLFTVRDVRCIGACGLAPVLTVDEKVYGHVTEDQVKDIINEYKEGNHAH